MQSQNLNVKQPMQSKNLNQTQTEKKKKLTTGQWIAIGISGVVAIAVVIGVLAAVGVFNSTPTPINLTPDITPVDNSVVVTVA